MWDGHLRPISTGKLRVDLESSDIRPIHLVSYSAAPNPSDSERSKMDNMLVMNVIKAARMEWAPPVVFTLKKDGSMRIYIDYRRSNPVTVWHSYPLPASEGCIDFLGDAQVSSTLDRNSGSWQIEEESSDLDKTLFSSNHGLYQITRMTFGF